jgi:hypothetical protein
MAPPSDKQKHFYEALMDKKLMTDAERAQLKAEYPSLNRRTICDKISRLMTLPWTPRPTAPVTSAPVFAIDDGYYALVDPKLHVMRFFRVRTPKRGRWIGFHFLSEVSGGNQLSMRDAGERVRIFTEIAKDTLGALKRFGQEIGQCGHCCKQLTDETSRQFGIGPVCRKALGI